jgi:hypothetical protein
MVNHRIGKNYKRIRRKQPDTGFVKLWLGFGRKIINAFAIEIGRENFRWIKRFPRKKIIKFRADTYARQRNGEIIPDLLY